MHIQVVIITGLTVVELVCGPFTGLPFGQWFRCSFPLFDHAGDCFCSGRWKIFERFWRWIVICFDQTATKNWKILKRLCYFFNLMNGTEVRKVFWKPPFCSESTYTFAKELPFSPCRFRSYTKRSSPFNENGKLKRKDSNRTRLKRRKN